MMLSPLTPSTAAPRNEAPTAGPHPEATPGALPFATMLKQSQPAPPAHPNEPAASHDAEPPAPDNEAHSAPEVQPAKAQAAPRAKARNAESKTTAPAHEPHRTGMDSATPETKATASRDEATATATPAALDPAMSAWLAAQQATATPRVPTAPQGKGPRDALEQAAKDTASANNGATPSTSLPLHAAGGQRPSDDAAHEAKPAAALPMASATEPALEATAMKKLEAPQPTEHRQDVPQPMAASFATTLAQARHAEAALAVALPTPVNAPEFSQALGLQMSVLLRDGVQTAELHLNPADMGPVSVQIVMDGTQAQIDFGADVAATRHAIEAGLPELASALREAGFTLTGGGVSEHSRSRDDSSGRDSGASTRSAARVSEGTDAAASASANATRRMVHVGGLDLYA